MIDDYLGCLSFGVCGGFSLGFIFSLLGFGIYKVTKLVERG